MKHYLAIFSEGFYESLESFATAEQRAAYAEGIVRGALFRGGTVTVYDLPEQLDTMKRAHVFGAEYAVGAYEARDA